MNKKTVTTMVAINPTILEIMLSINALNTPTKKKKKKDCESR